MANVVRSVRLPPDVIEYVESYPGRNFTEKIIGIVREHRSASCCYFDCLDGDSDLLTRRSGKPEDIERLCRFIDILAGYIVDSNSLRDKECLNVTNMEEQK